MVKLQKKKNGSATLAIPAYALHQLGWQRGDDISTRLDMRNGQLILFCYERMEESRLKHAVKNKSDAEEVAVYYDQRVKQLRAQLRIAQEKERRVDEKLDHADQALATLNNPKSAKPLSRYECATVLEDKK